MEIRERYLDLNAHAKSYTVKALVKGPNGVVDFKVGWGEGGRIGEGAGEGRQLRGAAAAWVARAEGGVGVPGQGSCVKGMAQA